MEQCKFSVIVVCYNAGGKLEKTVNSILAQRYENYEILVQDGGSSDGSVEKLRTVQAGNKKIRIVTEEDSGIYDAMNKAQHQSIYGRHCLFGRYAADAENKAAAKRKVRWQGCRRDGSARAAVPGRGGSSA